MIVGVRITAVQHSEENAQPTSKQSPTMGESRKTPATQSIKTWRTKPSRGFNSIRINFLQMDPKLHRTPRLLQSFIILHGSQQFLVTSALTALFYSNLYSLLSSLYVIFKFYAKFPHPFPIMEYHSISLLMSGHPPAPRPLSSFRTPPISSLTLLPTCWNYWRFHCTSHSLGFREPACTVLSDGVNGL